MNTPTVERCAEAETVVVPTTIALWLRCYPRLNKVFGSLARSHPALFASKEAVAFFSLLILAGNGNDTWGDIDGPRRHRYANRSPAHLGRRLKRHWRATRELPRTFPRTSSGTPFPLTPMEGALALWRPLIPITLIDFWSQATGRRVVLSRSPLRWDSPVELSLAIAISRSLIALGYRW